MFDYRKIALWIALLLVPGGMIVLLTWLFADMRRKKNAAKAAAEVLDDGSKASNEGSGPNPRTPDDGTTPRLAA